MGEEAIRLWMLQSRVREQYASSQSSVLVIADRSPTELLIDVVDQCRMGGAKDVGVITDKENG